MDSAKSEAESENDELRGLYLVPPHGELIASGKKKSIAKSRQFNLEGKWILVSGKLAYGTMELGKPEKVSTDEFDKRYEEHLVSRQDRLRWWPNASELFLYPVLDFAGYAKPRRVEVPPGVQTVMREVDFKQRADDLLVKLADLPDKFVWIPDFVALTGSQIYAKDREPRDVDIILRAEMAGDSEHFRVPVDGAMALKLERLLRDMLGTEEVQYTANAYGPNWKHLPLYDLALVRKRELKYYEPDEPEFAGMEYKARTLTTASLDRLLRGASSEVKQQAKTSFDEDAVKPGRAFVPLKPLRSATEGQRQTLDVFLDYIKANLEFPLYVSAKRDGFRATIHSNDGKVTVFSDDGAIVTDKLPNLVKRLGKLGKTWVIDCELELWKDGQHYPREATAGVIHSGEGDEDIAANIFRILYWDGKDLHNEPFEDIWATMQKLPVDTKTDGKLYPKKNGPINLVPHYEVKSLDALKSKVLSVAYKPGVEGVVVKRPDGAYSLDGQPGSPPFSLKWHKSFSATVTVLDKQQTRTSGVYVYYYGAPV